MASQPNMLVVPAKKTTDKAPDIKEVILINDYSIVVGGGKRVTFAANSVVQLDLNKNVAFMLADDGETYHIELEPTEYKMFS